MKLILYYFSKEKAKKKIKKLESHSQIVITKPTDNPEYLKYKKMLDDFIINNDVIGHEENFKLN